MGILTFHERLYQKQLLEDNEDQEEEPFELKHKQEPSTHKGKLYQKSKANLAAQLSKTLLRIKQYKGESPDNSESEEMKERDTEGQDLDLAPYWKVQYLRDIGQVAREGELLDKLQADPAVYQKLFNTENLAQSLERVKHITSQYKPLSYYTNQLSYLRSELPYKQPSISDMGTLFSVLEEEPASANAVLLEEILADSVGVKSGKRSRPGVMKVQTVVEDGGEVSPNTVKKVVGVLPENIESIRKYQIRPWKLPKFSDKFDKVDTISAMLGTGTLERFPTPLKTTSYLTERNLIMLDRLPTKGKKLGVAVTPEEQEAAIKEREERRQKYRQMPAAQREAVEKSMVSKQWLWIARKEVPKMHKIYLKYKTDAEANAKRIALQCAKEVKKKAAKCHKLEKEALLRAKRVHRDVLVYWRKKEKEIVEMKRKREKVEKEIKKKEEEQREALLMKKRLEFLIRQSDIYANFMARKLGIVQEEHPKAEVNPEVEIDDTLAKKRVQDMINSHVENLRAFDQETQAIRMERGGPAGVVSQAREIQEEELEDKNAFNRFDNPETSMSHIVAPPKIFLGGLKEYQLKGLRWLDNLHEQAINGILADEMGLGKTIQAIAFLAHLAENKGNWGPFLIVAPSSTLYNWQQEFKKFCPSLRVLPYWGALAERRTLRKFFNSKQLYTPTSPFHVLVTSYQLVVADEKSFHRVIWQYMILDEAQAIKNINSQRWKTLLGFNCRNRLLMTGTPIQNSMAELWALLHFIMPKLFDNHEQFQEWFSKDIEANSQKDTELNTRQLSRLHAVLKPFMLRRVKKDVEHEIGPKEEIEVFCEMTSRQKLLYQGIKNNLSNITDLFSLVDSKQKMENLMNLVMQLRKVCNHPELFERRVGKSPMLFRTLSPPKPLYGGFNQIPWITYTVTNPISYELPKIVFDELFNVFATCKGLNNEAADPRSRRVIDLYSPQNIYESFAEKGGFSAVRSLGFSFSEFSLLLSGNEMLAYLCLLHYQERLNTLSTYSYNIKLLSEDNVAPLLPNQPMLMIKKPLSPILYRTIEGVNRPLIYDSPLGLKTEMQHIVSKTKFYVANSSSVPITLHCSSNRFCHYYANVYESDILRYILLGNSILLPHNPFKGKSKFFGTTLLPNYNPDNYYEKPLHGYELFNKGLLPHLFYHLEGTADVEIPKFNKLVSDCAKLRILDEVLKKLKEEGHRCLIFCQMTKMLDILEDYLSWKKIRYFRMDGSSSIADRRDMVHEFQTNPNIFCFLLSTRAGGLGVTLTAADTVIFYDNDWNPTMDAQATDRAHRIGQTKKVSIYRLITKGTVEERIVKRAKQKQNVQATVYSGGAFKGDVFKPKEVIELLYDEDERKKHQQMAAAQQVKKAKKKEPENMEVEERKKETEKKQLFAIKKQANTNNAGKEGEEKMSDSGDDSDYKFEVNADIYDSQYQFIDPDALILCACEQ
eukprot:TRINITY_DN149_c0_g2_i1.p1 TRINITY_DN149_c0_g2~~TRINITY_DN149_c0_g2_i1.p1  ORF type:complete len:1444 (+),score=199.37 TRINITY_DN149_c0_g2_i1:629-4960(+)